jgi:hypothetical protein
VSSRATRVSIRLSRTLLERAEADADRCGLSVRQLVAEVAEAALVERLCPHAARVADPPTAPPEAD